MLPITTGQAPLDQLVLVNVDNGNLITTPFLDAMCEKAPALAQGNVGSVRFGGADGGVTGRVTRGAASFMLIGGYDETMLPIGYQDIDIWRRAAKVAPQGSQILAGSDLGRSIPNLPPNISTAGRSHPDMIAAKVANVERTGVAPASWTEMNRLNLQSDKKLALRAGELSYKRNEDAPFPGHPHCQMVASPL